MTKVFLIGLAIGTTTAGGISPALADPANASGKATLMRGELGQPPEYFFRHQELGLFEPDAVSRGAFLLADASEAGSRAWAWPSAPTPESGDFSRGAERSDSSYGGFDHLFVTPLNAPIAVPEPGVAALIATGAALIARQLRKRN